MEFKPEYVSAHYDVDLGFRLHVGEHSDALAQLLADSETKDWAFITACDPFGASFPARLNQARLAKLRSMLGEWVHETGRGHDGTADGCCEESFFVLGISEAHAVAMAREFEQESILVGPGPVPRLVNCFKEEEFQTEA